MVGQTISHYKILEKLGSGGMGVVYLAQDQNLNRQVALKFLPIQYATEAELLIRFQREAQAMAGLNHPNIVTIYEVADWDGRAFIAMEYVNGRSLREAILNTRLSVHESVDIALQICQGLSKVHGLGIFHRDLKPENILIDRDGLVKIVDFGIAKREGATKLTRDSGTVGTLYYASPEQFQGTGLDHRADIWSAGVILYEMITGQLPFSGDYEAQVIYEIIYGEAKPLAAHNVKVSKKFQRTLRKALTKKVGSRYKNVNEFMADLKQVGQTPTGRSTSRHSIKRTPRFLYPLIGLMLVVLASVYLIYKPYLASIAQASVLKNVVVVEPFTTQTSSSQSNELSSEMVEYLIIDDLLQSTQKTVMSKGEFDVLVGASLQVPEIEVGGSVAVKDFGYDIRLSLRGWDGNMRNVTISINDPVVLLTRRKTELTSSILEMLAVARRKKSTFTDRWDAFVNFYRGEKAWLRLERPAAINAFEAALDIDPNFVLAKLRLAQVLTFGRTSLQAQKLIRTIEPSLGELSYVDSLRAQALESELAGDLHNNVNILRQIYDELPARPESSFEVAEAYYDMCDIQNAIQYYLKTLRLDQNFARAHNHIGYCYTHLGLHDKALHHFRRYVTIDSTANAFDSLGDGYAAAGRLDSASWALLKGIELNPNVDYLYRSLSEIRIKQGRLQDAEKRADQYLQHAIGVDTRARAYFYKALIRYSAKEYQKALDYCLKAKSLHDTKDIVTRVHEVYWLLGLLYLELGEIENAKAELAQMEEIVRSNNVTPTNYRRYIYKNWLHLRACIAAQAGELPEMLDYIEEFDGPIKDKVKDHSSPFDLAYFNNSFGELLIDSKVRDLNLAEKRFRKALEYNPNFALAHHNLSRLYAATGDMERSAHEVQIFRSLWDKADPDVKRLFGISGSATTTLKR